jgi:SAM-dependent methyltransferase
MSLRLMSSGQSVRECPLCRGEATHALDARDRNRSTTPERFAYARCTQCQTVFLAHVPNDLAPYYRDDYYRFDADGQPMWKHEDAPRRAASYRVSLLQRYVAGARLLEIGCGTGAFAVAARDAGFEVTGIEMSERCCEYLTENEGINAICSDQPLDALRSLPRANAIAMWHVLEHLPNPAEVLEQLADKLEPGGILAIAVPNPSSLQFRLLKTRWVHLDAPRHLCLMPPAALVEAGARVGLRRVATTTTDPDGIECNVFGWLGALHRPTDAPLPWIVTKTAFAIEHAAAPIERSCDRGAAVTLLMQKAHEAASRTRDVPSPSP